MNEKWTKNERAKCKKEGKLDISVKFPLLFLMKQTRYLVTCLFRVS